MGRVLTTGVNLSLNQLMEVPHTVRDKWCRPRSGQAHVHAVHMYPHPRKDACYDPPMGSSKPISADGGLIIFKGRLPPGKQKQSRKHGSPSPVSQPLIAWSLAWDLEG